jgi:PTS system nitrogen regulatory IIA component
MPIASLLIRERVSTSERTLDRQDALAAVADLLGQSGALEALLQREQMGSTAIGHGVAVPHGRIPGLKTPIGAFLRLATPAQFGDQDVDLIFALLMPTDNPQLHLHALADIAALFSNDDVRERLRNAGDDDALFRLLTGDPSP